ncbi:MBOAT family protein [Kiritimatiellaeota bacterium B1221]|nr:MBOAT family protein [Kiritimatiellaeota bacterium B1221]
MTKTKEILKAILSVLPLLLFPVLATIWGQNQPGWIFMWVLAFGLYAGCKVLTARDIPPEAPRRGKWSYFLGWPGMDPELFLLGAGRIVMVPALRGIAFRNIMMGGICLFAIAPRIVDFSPMLAGWIGMSGLIFLLHFGLFHLLALHWQGKGFGAQPIMNRPHQATRLSEFWGRRWNRAFQCLTKRYVFRPLTPKIGAGAAMGLTFLLSGLIHEWVITVPAGGGFGGPTLYFLLQGAGVKMERMFGLKPQQKPGRVWTLTWVLLPAGLLFPAPFVLNVIVPMFKAWGIFPQGVL